jgi:hypothetical protein
MMMSPPYFIHSFTRSRISASVACGIEPFAATLLVAGASGRRQT